MYLKRINNKSLFYLAYIIMLVSTFLFKNSNLVKIINAMKIYNAAYFFVIILLLCKIVCTRYTRREFMLIPLIGLILVMSYIHSHEVGVIRSFIFIIAAKNISYKKVFDLTWKTSLISAVVIIGLALIGIIPNPILAYRFGVARMSFGFVAPGALGFIITFFIFSKLAKYYKKLNWKISLVTIIFCLFLWYIINVRTAMIVCIFMFIMFGGRRVFRKLIMNKIIPFTPWLIALLSLYFTIAYDSSKLIFQKLDGLFSLRLSLGSEMFKIFGISLFGSDTSTYYNQDLVQVLYIDNSYVSLAIRYGVIVLSLICLMYHLLLKYAVEVGNYAIVVGILTYLIFGMMEMVVYNVPYNGLMICLSCIIFKIQRKELCNLYKVNYDKEKSLNMDIQKNKKIIQFSGEC